MMIDGLNVFIAGLGAKWCAFTQQEHRTAPRARELTRGLLGVPILWPFSIFNLQTASIVRARSLVVGTHAMGCTRTYAFGVGH